MGKILYFPLQKNIVNVLKLILIQQKSAPLVQKVENYMDNEENYPKERPIVFFQSNVDSFLFYWQGTNLFHLTCVDRQGPPDTVPKPDVATIPIVEAFLQIFRRMSFPSQLKMKNFPIPGLNSR
ncbi:hypothetical protein TNCV_4567071 [Trichonephila clavipes]|nr:hypothetical protein TNCV_4567071 [Trichonephila clavipes]